MNRNLELIKEICRESEMWELDNPRVIGMMKNIMKTIETEESLNIESKETCLNIVLSNLIIFSRYEVEDVLNNR